MPTYVYTLDKKLAKGPGCNQCSEEFEMIQRITEDALKYCPSCDEPVQKLIQPSNFVLKGSCWYKDGYS